MQFDALKVPQAVPARRFRQPKENVPQTLEERTRVLHFVREFVAEGPTPMPAMT